MKKRNLKKEAKYAKSEQFLNRAQVLKSKKCGCSVCGFLFSPELITEWFDLCKLEEYDNVIIGTAICPYCDGDTIVPESECYTLDEELIKYMQDLEFEEMDKWCKENGFDEFFNLEVDKKEKNKVISD